MKKRILIWKYKLELFIRTIIPISKKILEILKYRPLYIHWHIIFGWDKQDYEIQWNELHKAHLIYARKLNKKYSMKIFNPGRKPRKRGAII